MSSHEPKQNRYDELSPLTQIAFDILINAAACSSPGQRVAIRGRLDAATVAVRDITAGRAR